MAEESFKRSRRPDSKQMWDEADRRSAPTSRIRDVPRDRREDRNRDRDRRYRSRSPRDFRSGRDAWRDDRDRNRDRGRDKEMDRDKDRERGRDERYSHGSRRDRSSGRDGRDRLRERSQSRKRDRNELRDNEHKRQCRSRSPRKEQEVQEASSIETPKFAESTEGISERTAIPVSFKVGVAQDHDRMDVDSDAKRSSKAKGTKTTTAEPEQDEEIVVEDDDAGIADMKAMMGFGDFGTTHQKKVPGNDISAVRKEKKTEYRQYMNRVGGFNRPLSPSR